MTKEAGWVVYIIQTKSGTLYTGITNDLNRRMAKHVNGLGARYFHFSDASRVLYCEQHPNRSSATKREIEIKKMTRAQKLDLIQGC